ncbi:hypothetical protein NGG16_16415 [Enterococcus casseliflavus]|uniref:hypothetical protein n=1 Tax=Enterococcus casseliflavus TaxID=37734 RepID=UPI002DB5D991|nr:hypothetical protein [Enterococcus casseliflavus]MEB8419020.1 hypothetical protein [Enterococcus casseliflavus]
MGKIVEFNREKVELYSPLVIWRESFSEELSSKNYTTFVSNIFFPNNPVERFNNFYDLNQRISSLQPGEKLVLFRNYHFEIFFYYSYEKQLTLRIGTLVNGIDAMFLESKFSEEKRIFTKYYKYILKYFDRE